MCLVLVQCMGSWDEGIFECPPFSDLLWSNSSFFVVGFFLCVCVYVSVCFFGGVCFCFVLFVFMECTGAKLARAVSTYFQLVSWWWSVLFHGAAESQWVSGQNSKNILPTTFLRDLLQASKRNIGFTRGSGNCLSSLRPKREREVI